jgi:hypothetical protein
VSDLYLTLLFMQFYVSMWDIIDSQNIRIYQPPVEADDEASAEHVRIFAQAMPFSIIGSTEDIQPPDEVLSEHLAKLIDTRHVLRETAVRSNQPAKFAHLSKTARFLYSSMTIVKTSIQVRQMSNLTSSMWFPRYLAIQSLTTC